MLARNVRADTFVQLYPAYKQGMSPFIICTLHVFSLLSVPLFRAAEMEALPAAFSLVEPKEVKELPLPQDSYCGHMGCC